MKKQITLAFALIAGVFAVSCNEDDDPKFENIDRMAGEWQLTKIGTLNGSAINYTNVGSCAPSLSFADSSFVQVDATLVDEACQTTTFSGLYGIEDGNLVLFYDDMTEATADILTLTDKELELVENDTETNSLTFLRYRKVTPTE